MKIWVSALFAVSLVCAGSGNSRAQTPPASAPTAKAAPLALPTDYPGESVVFDHLTRIYTFAADGTGTREVSGVIEVRNQAGVKALSVLPFDFASSAEHVEIDYVRVHHADGSIVATSAADAQELPTEVTREAPFYSDLKQEQIPVRSLQPGDLLEYKIRIVRTKPEAPGHFWGGERFFLPSAGIVIRSEVIELRVPKDGYLQVWSPNYKPTTTDSAANGTNGTAERVYHWQSAQLAPTAGQKKNALLKLDNNPTLGTSDDPPLPHIAWTNFHSWQEVGAWYRSLEGSRTQPDDDVRAKVATLTAGKSTPDEKARAIYAYVSSQVRYIGVAFGVGRFQPHNAGDVLSNQYGDCKDKSTLLISMLSAAGINADAVLIGAGITFNSAVPSPASFNHAITLAYIDGQPVWLDSTPEVSPFQLLNPLIRGKQALVIPATGDAQVETTPQDPPFPFLNTFEATGSLDDTGTSHSHIVMTFRGDEQVMIAQAVRTVSPAQWDELTQRVSYSIGYSGKVTNAELSHPDDTVSPFKLTYDYQRDKNGDWDNLRILPQLSPIGLADIDEKDPPVTPIQLGVPHLATDRAVMTLPKGWTANLPPSVHAKAAFATLDKTYKLENGVLTTNREFRVLQKDIPASQWQAYHQWFKDAGLQGETFIQLIPSEAAASSLPAPPITEDNPDAADLIRQASQTERRKDWHATRDLLDKARALNQNQPYLWSNYAFLSLQDHDMTYAVVNLKKELSIHPDEANVSRTLASVYMTNHNPDDAISTLQAAVDRHPTDESLILYLVSIYTQRGDNASAEKVLRAALLASPGSASLQLQLGQTLVREQKTTEGETLLRSVVTTSEDPLLLNNAAYELANNSLDLPLAENAARRALSILDQASNNGETGPNAISRTALIVSAWDTYGWILFRDNKIAEAEPWIRAAWRNSQSAETGYHLAMILEEQKHLPQALHQLELASKGRRGGDAAAVQKLIDDETAKLRPSVPPIPKKDPEMQAGPQLSYTVTAKKDPEMELHDQLSYQVPLGDLKPSGEGSAAVEIDVTNQGTTAFRIVSGDQNLQPISDTIQHLNLDLQLPPASHAKLVRRGILSCHNGPGCALLLLSTDGN
jgi:tetratricopeptide (TPR) repeat protein/transglutaminase-like putative cysteine protease